MVLFKLAFRIIKKRKKETSLPPPMCDDLYFFPYPNAGYFADCGKIKAAK